jgi:hypothetical protein
MRNNWHRADNPTAYLRTIVTACARRNCAGATASGDSTNGPGRPDFSAYRQQRLRHVAPGWRGEGVQRFGPGGHLLFRTPPVRRCDPPMGAA